MIRRRAKKLLAEAGYPNGFSTTINTTPGSKYWIEAIASNWADVGIKAEIKIWDGGSWYDAHIGKKLRGFITRNSWYDAETNAGSDLQDGYMEGMPWAYVTTKEISDTLNKNHSGPE